VVCPQGRQLLRFLRGVKKKRGSVKRDSSTEPAEGTAKREVLPQRKPVIIISGPGARDRKEQAQGLGKGEALLQKKCVPTRGER